MRVRTWSATCGPRGKWRYHSLELAEAALAGSKSRKRSEKSSGHKKKMGSQRVYYCTDCEGFHLTSGKSSKAKARESRAMASLGTGSADGDTHTTNGGMAGNSPAITVNTVLGLVLGVIVLLNLTLSPQQSAAITTIVTSLFVIIPVVAGFIIRAINTRRAQ